MFVFFFFQAEDGIRDDLVTGVQTCALPISTSSGVGRVDDVAQVDVAQADAAGDGRGDEIGRASCRERVQISVVAVSLKKKTRTAEAGRFSEMKVQGRQMRANVVSEVACDTR